MILPTSPRMPVNRPQRRGASMLYSAWGFICRDNIVLRCILVEEESVSLLDWWMNTEAQVISFHVLCLKKYLQSLFWIRLKSPGKFFMWIPIKLWVRPTQWLIWGQERSRRPAVEVSNRMGPPHTTEPGMGLDRACVCAEFCWLDTAKLLDLAEDEASLLGFPPPLNSTVTLAPIWIPLGVWPTRPLASRAREWMQSGSCLGGSATASIYKVTHLPQQHIYTYIRDYMASSFCFSW